MKSLSENFVPFNKNVFEGESYVSLILSKRESDIRTRVLNKNVNLRLSHRQLTEF